MPTLSSASLRAFAEDILVAAGVPEEEAQIVTDGLLMANLSGHDSHGVLRVPQYLDAMRAGHIVPGAPYRTARIRHFDGVV